ncbi:MAG: D-ornithine 4,5-aminomutase subunit OraE [Patescibacteria group bacterium]
MTLLPETKLDVEAILADLEHYRPRRQGWHWRDQAPPGTVIGQFAYDQISAPLRRGIPLPAAGYFGAIDPQPDCTVTTEIASGRFEDDLRRMRMAVWHGADHIMVIRTTGQSHIDGLMEGTPEGIGGIPITRKQLRATRKALDLMEDEVGRPINLHSYVSGLAGPEIAVLFAEEGVNGAHQDPQYNVLYRNVNMVRSFVDAAEAKKVMTWGGMIQIDGAHNANATAREAWKVMPELMVQHAINCAFSIASGMPMDSICLSTVPPVVPPLPEMRLDLPYAVALRDFFSGYRMRAQMNTKYITSSTREATVTHALNLFLSRLTSADIQSTITPDEARNVPWHYNNIHAVDTARQVLVGLDGLRRLVRLRDDGELPARVREIKERAVLFLQEMLELGGYFKAVEEAFFVDSGYYPEGVGDGIARRIDGGVGAGTVVPREPDYFAPVCAHFGQNNLPEPAERPCALIGGCTLCRPEKIAYLDELDEEDNVRRRLAEHAKEGRGHVKPEVQWRGDGFLSVTMFLPVPLELAEAAAVEIGRRMNLADVEVIHAEVMHPAEGTLVEIKGRIGFALDEDELVVPTRESPLSPEEIRAELKHEPYRLVAATVGEDEHSVGMREILDIKHGGLEGFGFKSLYLGTSVPVAKAIDAAIEYAAEAILISTVISHADIHRRNMRRLHQLCLEKGVRERFVLVAGGPQVTGEMAREEGLDGGFGRGTRGLEVASFLVRARRARRGR